MLQSSPSTNRSCWYIRCFRSIVIALQRLRRFSLTMISPNPSALRYTKRRNCARSFTLGNIRVRVNSRQAGHASNCTIETLTKRRRKSVDFDFGGGLKKEVKQHWRRVFGHNTLISREDIRYQWAIESTNKEFLLIIHDDVFFKSDALSLMLRNAQSSPNCAIIGPLGQCWRCGHDEPAHLSRSSMGFVHRHFGHARPFGAQSFPIDLQLIAGLTNGVACCGSHRPGRWRKMLFISD